MVADTLFDERFSKTAACKVSRAELIDPWLGLGFKYVLNRTNKLRQLNLSCTYVTCGVKCS